MSLCTVNDYGAHNRIWTYNLSLTMGLLYRWSYASIIAFLVLWYLKTEREPNSSFWTCLGRLAGWLRLQPIYLHWREHSYVLNWTDTTDSCTNLAQIRSVQYCALRVITLKWLPLRTHTSLTGRSRRLLSVPTTVQLRSKYLLHF
jgi:hypothetical protein